MQNILKTISTNRLYILNLGSTFFSQFANAVTLIALTPLLRDSLGMSNFGVYGVVLNVIAFSVILDFGLNIGLVRKFIHQIEALKALVSTVFFFFISLLFLLFPIYLLFYFKFLNNSAVSFVHISFFTAIIVAQNILAGYFDALIQSQNKVYVSKFIRAGKLLVELLFILVFLKNISISKILIITTTVNIAYLASLYLYLKKEINLQISIKLFSWEALRCHFKYCFWYFFASLATVLVFNTQIVVLNYYCGAALAAKYLIIIRFFDIIRIAATNFTQVLFPKIIIEESNQNWVNIKRLFAKMVLRISLLVLVIFALFYTIGIKVFIAWSKLPDTESLHIYYLYLLFTGFIIIDNVSVVFLSALKLNRYPTIVSIVQGALCLTSSVVLIQYLGLVGLILACIGSFIVTNMLFNPLFLIKSINQRVMNI